MPLESEQTAAGRVLEWFGLLRVGKGAAGLSIGVEVFMGNDGSVTT